MVKPWVVVVNIALFGLFMYFTIGWALTHPGALSTLWLIIIIPTGLSTLSFGVKALISSMGARPRTALSPVPEQPTPLEAVESTTPTPMVTQRYSNQIRRTAVTRRPRARPDQSVTSKRSRRPRAPGGGDVS